MKHALSNIITDSGEVVQAQAPVIVSASRATDIPAFYADWFFNRLVKGYARWRNPFNGKDSFVSFSRTRFIVFWSKNPAPLLRHLHVLENNSIGCYIQFTLNDYEREMIEPNIPSLNHRLDCFKRLVESLGVGSVVWRFDPLLLTDEISIDALLDKVQSIGDSLKGYTEKLVFSFADITSYKRVGPNLTRSGVRYVDWDESSMYEFASKLAVLNAGRWNYNLATCAESISLEQLGIKHNRCIDPELISRLAPEDHDLKNFLFCADRDRGQRKNCGCIISKDIGSYNTCANGCMYCYANTSFQSARANYQKHIITPNKDSIL